MALVAASLAAFANTTAKLAPGEVSVVLLEAEELVQFD